MADGGGGSGGNSGGNSGGEQGGFGGDFSDFGGFLGGPNGGFIGTPEGNTGTQGSGADQQNDFENSVINAPVTENTPATITRTESTPINVPDSNSFTPPEQSLFEDKGPTTVQPEAIEQSVSLVNVLSTLAEIAVTAFTYGAVRPDFDGWSPWGQSTGKPGVSFGPPTGMLGLGLLGSLLGVISPTAQIDFATLSPTLDPGPLAGPITEFYDTATEEDVPTAIGNLVDNTTTSIANALPDVDEDDGQVTVGGGLAGYNNGSVTGPGGGGFGSDNIPIQQAGLSTPAPEIIAAPIAEPIAPPLNTPPPPPDQYVFGQYGNTYKHVPAAAGLNTANA